MSAVLNLARRVPSFVFQPIKTSSPSGRLVRPTARRANARWAAASMAVLGLLGFAGSRQAAGQITAHANTFVSGTTALTNPYIAVDVAGNIYSVQGTNPIHKGSFNSSGVYTETALTGTPAYTATGIAVDGSGNVYVSENSGTGTIDTHVIEQFAAGNGTATSIDPTLGGASLEGVAVDAGGDLFAPRTDGTLLTLTSLGVGAGYLTTTPADGIATPTGIAMGASGTIYVSSSDGSISQLTPVGTPVVVSYTAAVSFTVTAPATGVAVDAAGNLYGSGTSGIISELPSGASTAVAFRTAAANVASVAVDATGSVYFAAGTTISKATSGQVLPTTAVATTSTAIPVSFAIDSNGGGTALGTLSNSNVLAQGVTAKDFTYDSSTCSGITPTAGSTCTVNVIFQPTAPGLRLGAVNLTDASGNVVATAYINGTGTGPQGVIFPGTQTTPITVGAVGVAVDPSGDIFALSLSGNVIKASPSGNTYTQTTLGSGLGANGNLALDGSGNLYIADGDNNRVVKETLTGGTYAQSVVGSVTGPTGVAVDGAGNVYVTSGNAPLAVTKFSQVAGGYISSQIPLTGNSPTGIAVDGAGNLFVTDGGTNNVVELSFANGAYTQSTVVTGLSGPSDLVVDAAGDLYVADGGNNRVVIAVPSAGVYTVSPVLSGITQPTGVALDSVGNLYAATNADSHVVKLDVADTQTFTFPNTAIGATSATQTGTLTNIGNSALTLPTPNAGSNPSLSAGFSLSNSSTCPQLSTSSAPFTLAPATSCTEVIDFTPDATMGASTVNGQLAITDNSLNANPSATQTISLTGAAIGPPTISAAFNPTSINVGSNTVLTFTIGNPTGNPVGLTNVGFTDTLPAGLLVASPSGANTACGTSLTATAGGTGISLSGLSLAAGASCAFSVNVSATAGGSYTVTTGAVTSDQGTGGSATANLSVPQPTITNINPNTGLTVGLTAVTITGTNFLPNGAAASTVSVTFGGTAATVTSVTDGSISVLTPAHAAGAVDVVVTTINGTVTTAGGFTYGVPTLSLTPTLGAGMYGSAYSQNIQASGGLPPYTYSVKAGTGNLPPGLTLTTNTAALPVTPNSGTISGTPTAAGAYTFTITTTDANNYTFDQQYTLTINKAALSVTVNNASFTYGGTYPTFTGTPSGFVLSDTAASVGLTYATTVATTSTSTAGTYTITATLNDPAAQNNYNLTVTTGTLTINKATPVLTAPAASPINFGQTLASSTLSGGSASYNGNNVTGTFTWTDSTIAPTAGTHSYSVTFTPDAASSADYTTNTTNVTITVNKATPTIQTKPTASEITFGQTLASSTLTGGAAVNGTVSVAGTFSWTDSTIAPGAGTPSYSVTFTPTDGANYNPTTTTVSVTVDKATPTITTLPTASTITFGQMLSASTLTGGAAVSGPTSVGGTFAWTNGGTIPPAGTASYSVTFTPTDGSDYNSTTVNVSVTVSKSTPTITTPPTASTITYGQTLASSTLTGGAAVNGTVSVAGTFTWTNSSIAPNAGTPTYSVTFTPTDTADYNTTTVPVTLTVLKATPTITGSPTASSIVYGATLSTSKLTGGSATTTGTFAWTNGAIVPGAGTASYSVTFTPSDLSDYNTTTVNVTLIVNKATPTVTTPPTASPITYGAALSTSSLTGGVGSPAGTFAWANGAAIPKAGTASYTVTFTPNDTTDYNTINLSVSVTVSKATPTITALPTASAITYGQMLSASTLSGGSGSTAGSFAWTNGSTVPSGGTASYPVTFTPTDTTDYNTASGSVSITVNQAAQTITFVQPASPVTYGDATAITLSATASSGLAPVFSIVSGPGTISGTTLTITGAGTIVVAADQPGDGNYLAATQVRRNVVVNVAPQTITFTQPTSPVAYGSVSTVALSATGGASGNPVTFSVLSGPGRISGSTLTITGAGTIIVAADQAGAANYGTASEVQRSIVVSMAAQVITFTQPTSPIPYGSAMTFGLSATGGASGNPVTFSLVSGPATINGSAVTILTAGSIVVAADQTGNTNYSAANEAQRTIVVSKASVTLMGPASQPVLVGASSTGSVPVSITGQYSGSAIAVPSGSITYSILNSANATVANGSLTISNGMVNVPVPNTLAAGQYTISLTYTGDTNYATSTLMVGLSVGQFQPSIVWAQPAAISYGTTLAGVLTAVAQDQTGATPKSRPRDICVPERDHAGHAGDGAAGRFLHADGELHTDRHGNV